MTSDPGDAGEPIAGAAEPRDRTASPQKSASAGPCSSGSASPASRS